MINKLLKKTVRKSDLISILVQYRENNVSAMDEKIHQAGCRNLYEPKANPDKFLHLAR